MTVRCPGSPWTHVGGFDIRWQMPRTLGLMVVLGCSGALARAGERLELPLDQPKHMPRDFRQLDPNAFQPLLSYMRGDARSAEDAALLRRAVELGMAIEVTERRRGDRALP
jgi:hypothetical protein